MDLGIVLVPQNGEDERDHFWWRLDKPPRAELWGKRMARNEFREKSFVILGGEAFFERTRREVA